MKHITEILLHDKKYNMIIEGSGIPCLIIGLASIPFKLLPEELKTKYCFISSDIYWGSSENPLDIVNVTIDTLVDDIESIRRSLGLEKVVILSHSAFGILAFAYALKYGENVAGIIAIASPPYWNDAVLADGKKRFAEKASLERKAAFNDDFLQYQAVDLNKLSKSEAWILKYNTSNAKYWHDFKEDHTAIWNDISVNSDLFDHFFVTLLSRYDKSKEYLRIQSPVFLALGEEDYIVSPHLWKNKANYPEWTVKTYENSAHYPMLEEADKFAKDIIAWSKYTKEVALTSGELIVFSNKAK